MSIILRINCSVMPGWSVSAWSNEILRRATAPLFTFWPATCASRSWLNAGYTILVKAELFQKERNNNKKRTRKKNIKESNFQKKKNKTKNLSELIRRGWRSSSCSCSSSSRRCSRRRNRRCSIRWNVSSRSFCWLLLLLLGSSSLGRRSGNFGSRSACSSSLAWFHSRRVIPSIISTTKTPINQSKTKLFVLNTPVVVIIHTTTSKHWLVIFRVTFSRLAIFTVRIRNNFSVLVVADNQLLQHTRFLCSTNQLVLQQNLKETKKKKYSLTKKNQGFETLTDGRCAGSFSKHCATKSRNICFCFCFCFCFFFQQQSGFFFFRLALVNSPSPSSGRWSGFGIKKSARKGGIPCKGGLPCS